MHIGKVQTIFLYLYSVVYKLPVGWHTQSCMWEEQKRWSTINRYVYVTKDWHSMSPSRLTPLGMLETMTMPESLPKLLNFGTLLPLSLEGCLLPSQESLSLYSLLYSLILECIIVEIHTVVYLGPVVLLFVLLLRLWLYSLIWLSYCTDFCSLLIAPKQDIIMLSGGEYLNNDNESINLSRIYQAWNFHLVTSLIIMAVWALLWKRLGWLWVGHSCPPMHK